MPPLFIPPRTILKMKNAGIRDADIDDLFKRGEHLMSKAGAKMVIKKHPHSGYEIGAYYVTDDKYGRYVVTAAWKRKLL